MPIYIGNNKWGGGFVGSARVRTVYIGSEKVYPTGTSWTSGTNVALDACVVASPVCNEFVNITNLSRECRGTGSGGTESGEYTATGGNSSCSIRANHGNIYGGDGTCHTGTGNEAASGGPYDYDTNYSDGACGCGVIGEFGTISTSRMEGNQRPRTCLQTSDQCGSVEGNDPSGSSGTTAACTPTTSTCDSCSTDVNNTQRNCQSLTWYRTRTRQCQTASTSSVCNTVGWNSGTAGSAYIHETSGATSSTCTVCADTNPAHTYIDSSSRAEYRTRDLYCEANSTYQSCTSADWGYSYSTGYDYTSCSSARGTCNCSAGGATGYLCSSPQSFCASGAGDSGSILYNQTSCSQYANACTTCAHSTAGNTKVDCDISGSYCNAVGGTFSSSSTGLTSCSPQSGTCASCNDADNGNIYTTCDTYQICSTVYKDEGTPTTGLTSCTESGTCTSNNCDHVNNTGFRCEEYQHSCTGSGWSFAGCYSSNQTTSPACAPAAQQISCTNDPFTCGSGTPWNCDFRTANVTYRGNRYPGTCRIESGVNRYTRNTYLCVVTGTGNYYTKTTYACDPVNEDRYARDYYDCNILTGGTYCNTVDWFYYGGSTGTTTNPGGSYGTCGVCNPDENTGGLEVETRTMWRRRTFTCEIKTWVDVCATASWQNHTAGGAGTTTAASNTGVCDGCGDVSATQGVEVDTEVRRRFQDQTCIIGTGICATVDGTYGAGETTWTTTQLTDSGICSTCTHLNNTGYQVRDRVRGARKQITCAVASGMGTRYTCTITEAKRERTCEG